MSIVEVAQKGSGVKGSYTRDLLYSIRGLWSCVFKGGGENMTKDHPLDLVEPVVSIAWLPDSAGMTDSCLSWHVNLIRESRRFPVCYVEDNCALRGQLNLSLICARSRWYIPAWYCGHMRSRVNYGEIFFFGWFFGQACGMCRNADTLLQRYQASHQKPSRKATVQ